MTVEPPVRRSHFPAVRWISPAPARSHVSRCPPGRPESSEPNRARFKASAVAALESRWYSSRSRCKNSTWRINDTGSLATVATRSEKLLVAPGIATRSKGQSRRKSQLLKKKSEHVRTMNPGFEEHDFSSSQHSLCYDCKPILPLLHGCSDRACDAFDCTL